MVAAAPGLAVADVLAPGVALTVAPEEVVVPGVAVTVLGVVPTTEPLGVFAVPPTVVLAPVLLGAVAAPAPAPVAVVAAPVPIAVVAAPVPVAVVPVPTVGVTGHGPLAVPDVVGTLVVPALFTPLVPV